MEFVASVQESQAGAGWSWPPELVPLNALIPASQGLYEVRVGQESQEGS